MNRKVVLSLYAILLCILVVGVFGTSTSPTSSSPSPSPQVTATDIQVLNVVPGVSTAAISGQSAISDLGVTVLNAGSIHFNFTSAFAFSPLKGFVQVDSASVTILYTLIGWNTGDQFNVHINGAVAGTIPVRIFNAQYPLTVSGSLNAQTLRQGSNTVDIGINQGGTSTSQGYLYQVRITVEYTYLAVSSVSP